MHKLFQEPNWWTAAFMALVVGIVANFITHAILKALARFSPTFREWRQGRRAAFVREAEHLARDIGFILDTA
jgi:hypothetical protein